MPRGKGYKKLSKKDKKKFKGLEKNLARSRRGFFNLTRAEQKKFHEIEAPGRAKDKKLPREAKISLGEFLKGKRSAHD